MWGGGMAVALPPSPFLHPRHAVIPSVARNPLPYNHRPVPAGTKDSIFLPLIHIKSTLNHLMPFWYEYELGAPKNPQFFFASILRSWL
jgi:hypothetical protein